MKNEEHEKEEHEKQDESRQKVISISLPNDFKVVPANESDDNGKDYIDLVEVARTIWNRRMTIVKFVMVGAVLGVFYALASSKEYRSVATLMPEYEAGSGGGTSSLLRQYGSLLGISGGTYSSNSNAIRVTLYPNIVQSSGFQLQMMYQPFYFSDIDSTVTIFDYFTELRKPGILSVIRGYTIGLPMKLIRGLMSLVKEEEEEMVLDSLPGSESQILRLTKAESEMIAFLRQNITASLDEETGIVGVSVTMPNAQAAANIAEYAITLLTEYLVDYRVGKELTDLEFIEVQLAEATTRFENAQEELASFREQYRGNLSVRTQTEEQRLESNYQVAFNLYNSLMQQREQAKLKVQEQTPLFKTLEPVQVPQDDESSGFLTLFVFVTVCGMLSLFTIFFGDKLIQLKETITT